MDNSNSRDAPGNKHRRNMNAEEKISLLSDSLAIVGALLFAAGVFSLCGLGAGLMALGGVCIAYAWLIARNNGGESK